MAEIILDSSDKAAQYKTGISGWVSRSGNFFEDERMARYDGCTHRTCECGEVMERGYSSCAKCREKNDHERWLALPLVEWDGITPLYSDRLDKYFWHDDFEDEEMESLDLVICEPTYARELDSDRWEDDLPEDGDVPAWLDEAIDKFNEIVRANHEPLSWFPGKKRVILKEEVPI